MNYKVKAFTLVELIVVITILAILWTIAFISLQEYNWDARKSKILYDLRNLNSAMEVYLSRWWDMDNIISNNKTITNWVNTWKTVSSGAYILWNLKYEVGTFNFEKLKINGSDFVYDDSWIDRDYIFWYTKTPEALYYEFAGQTLNNSWKYNIIISWNYSNFWSWDSLGLISENWYDLWLQNWDTLTWSLY